MGRKKPCKDHFNLRLEFSRVKLCVKQKEGKCVVLEIGQLSLQLNNALLAGKSLWSNRDLWTKVIAKKGRK